VSPDGTFLPQAPVVAGAGAPVAPARVALLRTAAAGAGALWASLPDADVKRSGSSTDVSQALGSANDIAVGGVQTGSDTAVTLPGNTATAPTFQVHAQVDGADFAQGLSERVSFMVDNGLNGAKLQVNPAQLGPIELRIAVSGGHAQVWMTTHSTVTRDALESSSDKLKDMLGAQGFGQVSVDISQRSFQERSTYEQPYERESSSGRGAAATAAVASVASVGTAPMRGSSRGLDTYA